jgi:hypothetical protein
MKSKANQPLLPTASPVLPVDQEESRHHFHISIVHQWQHPNLKLSSHTIQNQLGSIDIK